MTVFAWGAAGSSGFSYFTRGRQWGSRHSNAGCAVTAVLPSPWGPTAARVHPLPATTRPTQGPLRLVRVASLSSHQPSPPPPSIPKASGAPPSSGLRPEAQSVPPRPLHPHVRPYPGLRAAAPLGQAFHEATTLSTPPIPHTHTHTPSLLCAFPCPYWLHI